jgi:hypothetical protein
MKVLEVLRDMPEDALSVGCRVIRADEEAAELERRGLVRIVESVPELVVV